MHVDPEINIARVHGMPLENVVDIIETGEAAKISANTQHNGTDETDRSVEAAPRWAASGRYWRCVCGPSVSVMPSEERCPLCGADRPDRIEGAA